MEIKRTKIPGVYDIQCQKLGDTRGAFVKTFHAEIFKKHNLEYDFKESFYSTSRKGVLRGMHFQAPPHEHAKLIYVLEGEILDVALDIRKNSKTYGKYYSVHLSAQNTRALYLAKGIAHGFLTMSESATVIYLTTSVHAPDYDSGILWNSFNFNWPMRAESIVTSERDSKHVKLNELKIDF